MCNDIKRRFSPAKMVWKKDFFFYILNNLEKEINSAEIVFRFHLQTEQN